MGIESEARALQNIGGLSPSLVLLRQEEEGLNELPTSKPRRLHRIIFGICKEPMVFLLLGCGFIYLTIGDKQEAIMLLGFLFLIIGIEIFQERKAERALDALRDLSSPRALVLRGGAKLRIPGKEVVRGDILFVNEGDRVAADSILFSGSHVAADESLLTGESIPVDKKVEEPIFAGTTIVRGQGIAIVTSIGVKTEIGKIGKSIQTSVRTYTQLESQTHSLVKRVAWVAGALCVFVFILYAITRGDWLQGFLVGLTLAMAILPNELPAVLTIFLALGAWRMSQRRVLTRKLPAIENLGATTLLCVDKTGTLTLNQMRIQRLFTNGQLIDLSEDSSNVLPESFHEILEFGILASRKDPFDPMELAFVSAGIQYLKGTEHLHQDWTLQKEYPLTRELLALSHAWKPKKEGGFVIGAKGAPEAIIDLCHLTKTESDSVNQYADEMARSGLRVLGVAKAETKITELPSQQHDFEFSFLGLIGIADPIRPGVAKAVSECRSAGVRVVMITGDHPVTAGSIAAKIGLQWPNQIITGVQLNQLSDADLASVVKKTSVFSRVSPDQKLRIVNAFKAQGEIVSMTGDGVNDAPSLKSAHIGIAMGGRGTDVARESSALVLLDDDFGSIVEAIRMGRRIHANLKSALAYLFSVHIPIAGMSILPVVFNLPLVLLPAHIALLHLIIEPASSVAFEVEPPNENIMSRPPRDPNEPLFNRKMWLPSLINGTSILIALLGVYLIGLARGQGEAEVRALVFTTLILSNLFLIFLNRGSEQSLLKKFNTSHNQVLGWITFGTIILLCISLYVPSARDVLKFSFLHLIDLGICLIVAIASTLWTTPLQRRITRIK